MKTQAMINYNIQSTNVSTKYIHYTMLELLMGIFENLYNQFICKFTKICIHGSIFPTAAERRPCYNSLYQTIKSLFLNYLIIIYFNFTLKSHGYHKIISINLRGRSSTYIGRCAP